MADFGAQVAKFASRCTPLCASSCYAPDNTENPVKLIERSFQTLSLEEKRKIQQDMYGDEKPIEESTKFIDEKLQELQKELDKLTIGFKKAYLEAVEQEKKRAITSAAAAKLPTSTNEDEHDPRNDDNKENKHKEGENNVVYKPYVSSREFLLMFLRSERFNACLAARRLARYFKEKLVMFGKDKLSLKIKQSDLDEKDLEILRSGHVAIPGITDRSGRLIVIGGRCWYGGQAVSKKCINAKRVLLYLFQCWLEDHEEYQKKGVVFISWQTSPPDATNKSTSLSQLYSCKPILDMLQRVLPIRTAAIHRCYSDQREHMVINFILLVMPTHIRRRYVLHCGPPEACMFDMIPFGIDVDALPLTRDGNFRVENMIQYVDKLRQKEEKNT